MDVHSLAIGFGLGFALTLAIAWSVAYLYRKWGG